MNSEAEAKCAALTAEAIKLGVIPYGVVAECTRLAMQWAYADAAMLAREKFKGQYATSLRRIGAEQVAEAIEARAK